MNREVATSSGPGIAHQRQGWHPARTALLTLAVDRSAATDAVTEVCQNNVASQGVSRKLGYWGDGISLDRRGDEVVTL